MFKGAPHHVRQSRRWTPHAGWAPAAPYRHQRVPRWLTDTSVHPDVTPFSLSTASWSSDPRCRPGGPIWGAITGTLRAAYGGSWSATGPRVSCWCLPMIYASIRGPRLLRDTGVPLVALASPYHRWSLRSWGRAPRLWRAEEDIVRAIRGKVLRPRGCTVPAERTPLGDHLLAVHDRTLIQPCTQRTKGMVHTALLPGQTLCHKWSKMYAMAASGSGAHPSASGPASLAVGPAFFLMPSCGLARGRGLVRMQPSGPWRRRTRCP